MTTPEKCEAVINEMKPLIDSLSKRIESLELHHTPEIDGDLANENKALKEENESLKTEIKKLNYRILHLKRGIEEEQKKDEEIQKLNYRIKHLVRNLNGGELPPCSSSSSSSSNNLPNPSIPSPSPSFYRVNLIVGKVLDCKIHEKANRLLYETIDCGEKEPRTICSSVREFYKPEDLIGKLVCVVANLKPRKFCGMMSCGMLLCAVTYDGENETGCEIMEPPEGSTPGERVYINELPVTEADSVIDNKSDAWESVKPYMNASNESIGMYCGCKLITSKGALKCKTLKQCQLS